MRRARTPARRTPRRGDLISIVCWKGAEWLVPLLLYAVLIVPGAIRNRDQINPDGVCYIRRGLYLAQGDVPHSISAYWSPLLSWCIAPLLKAGMDGQYAARLALALWGGVYVLAFAALVRRFVPAHRLVRFVAASAVAIAGVRLALIVIAPDLPMAALLLIYLRFAADERLLTSKRTPLLAGVIGAVAYLAKAYAFPFVLAHFLGTVVLRAMWAGEEGGVRSLAGGVGSGGSFPLARALRGEGRGEEPSAATGAGLSSAQTPLAQSAGSGKEDMPTRAWDMAPAKSDVARGSSAASDSLSHRLCLAARAWAIGMLGFAALAAPWIMAIHTQYHRWMFSTSGPINHANIAPRWFQSQRQPYFGVIPAPFLSRNEITDLGDHPDWSPFASREYFRYQVKIAVDHLVGVKAHDGASRQIGMLEAIGRFATGWVALLIAVAGVAMLVAVAIARWKSARAAPTPGLRHSEDPDRTPITPPLRQAPASPSSNPTDIFKLLWLLATMTLYAAPFLLVFFEPRYIEAVLIPLFIVLALQLGAMLEGMVWQAPAPHPCPLPAVPGRGGGSAGAPVHSLPPPWARLLAPLVLLLPFLVAQSIQAAQCILHARRQPYRQIAAKVHGLHNAGRLASTDRVRGLFVSFFADQRFVYFPDDREEKKSAEQLLTEAEADTLLIWDDPEPGKPPDVNVRNVQAARQVVRNRDWKLKGSVRLPKGAVEIYAR